MSLVINTNIASLNAQNNLSMTQSSLDQALSRLSSGLRINSPADDPAGYAIAQRMTAQINGFNQAVRNANDGISFAQVANGALNTVTNSLQRVRTLAIQSANATNSAQDRQALNSEVQQAIQQVNSTAQNTQFNGQSILNGSLNGLVFQVGANANQTITAQGVDVRGQSLGATYGDGQSIDSADLAAAAIGGKTLQIQGNLGTASVTFANQSYTVSGAVAQINSISSQTGVYAQRTDTTSADVAFTSPAAADTININGVNISVAASATAADAINAINAYTSQTGVTAKIGTAAGSINLSNTDGSSISVSGGTSLTDIPKGGGTASASFSLNAGIELYTKVGGSIQVGGTAAAGLLDSANTGTLAALAGGTTTLTLNSTSVLTVADAQTAVKAMDFALTQMSGFGGELGALQSRFQSTISNLQSASQNTTAARSRIQDANFAAETAALSRAKILQQAGVAMVAQANAQPQIALSLLK